MSNRLPPAAPPLPWLDVPPLAWAGGRVRLPGSKSISNRALLLAALAEGRTELRGVLASDDTRVMLQSLRTLGLHIEAGADAAVVRIDGCGGRLAVRDASLFLGNAGTAMRPLAAVLALLAARDGGRYRLHGTPRMHERPIGDLIDALRPLGCAIECEAREGYPPLLVGNGGNGGGTGAPRLAHPVRVRGDVSSQFLTALLMALPLWSGAQPVVVEVEGELISRPYIGITLAMMERFGVTVERDGWQHFEIPAASRYRAPGVLDVEADASSASYFIAAGALAAADAPIVIEGVGAGSVQGDVAFVEAARAMGAEVAIEPGQILVRRGAWPLRGITLDATAIPDAAMTLVPMALYADAPTTLTGIASWRVKETDRIAAMAAEARKLGATVEAGADWLRIHPPARIRPAAIETYDDHRIAMCFALAAFNPLHPGHAGVGVPVRILDPGCVAKTFPDFFAALFGCTRAAEPAQVPVITIDGPTASGKGTLAAELAARLGWHRLDSGVLYRAVALAWRCDPAFRADADPADHAGRLAALAAGLVLRFDGDRTLWQRTTPDGRSFLEDVTDSLREEATGNWASKVSAVPAVRQALHALQLGMRQAPGLVADGRDMGTVVFPDAPLKVFLVADADQRAARRHKQLISKGISANLDGIAQDLRARDARDRGRAVAPLAPAADAARLDNSDLDIPTSVERVLGWWLDRQRTPAWLPADASMLDPSA